LAFLFRALGFEDSGIALNRRDAAPFTLVRGWTLRRFVFVNPRKFDLKALFTQRPDFEFGAFRLSGAVDLSGCDALVTVRLRRNK
jgi:hypothetical protein